MTSIYKAQIGHLVAYTDRYRDFVRQAQNVHGAAECGQVNDLERHWPHVHLDPLDPTGDAVPVGKGGFARCDRVGGRRPQSTEMAGPS
jgi:hypothetical protein